MQGELTPENYRFPEVSNPSEKDPLPEEQPTHTEPFPLKIKQKNPTPILDGSRRHVLENCLLKLSAIEIDGKEHVEEYLRSQYRRYFKAGTIKSSYASLECFLKLIKGKGDIKNIAKRDLEKFVEHEQDRGMKLSTVKLRLAVIKAFMRFPVQVNHPDVPPENSRIPAGVTLPDKKSRMHPENSTHPAASQSAHGIGSTSIAPAGTLASGWRADCTASVQAQG